ncbi:MAG TPA: lipoprotein insertase outer membrane protein LolB [Geobacteraceae bacterium]
MCGNVRRSVSILSFITVLSLFFGCAVAPRQPLTGLIPGKEVETLQSEVAISVRTPDRSMGVRGFLVFKRPDRFHLALLSPFGPTLADIYSDGERFSCVIPSRQTAYSGRIADLPDRDGLKAWSLMRWVVERTPIAGPALVRENVNSEGVLERLYYDDQGFLERKETVTGDRVAYRDYRNVEGVAFPGSIELTDSRGNMVTVVFEEPEVNKPVEEAALAPRLEGVTVLPFSEFHGF